MGGTDWLEGLACSRLAAQVGAPPGSDEPAMAVDMDPQGRRRVTLQLRQPADSSAAVAGLLLSSFVEATTSSARAREAMALLRSLQVTAAEPAAAAGGGSGNGEHAAPAGLHVQFVAIEPAAEAQVEEAARLFEAYWQFHVKAAKSDLHARMRQRLMALSQRLALTKFDGS